MFVLRKISRCYVRLKAGFSYRQISSERGQASAEYVIALFVGIAVVVVLFAVYSHFSSAGSASGSHSAKTYSRAPYTLPGQGAVSEQWAKDLIVH